MVVGGCCFPIYYTFYKKNTKRTIEILITTTTKCRKSGGNLGKNCWLLFWLLVVTTTDQNSRPEDAFNCWGFSFARCRYYIINRDELQAVFLRASTKIQCLTPNRTPNQYQMRICQCLWAVGLSLGWLWAWAGGWGVFLVGVGGKISAVRWAVGGSTSPCRDLTFFAKGI